MDNRSFAEKARDEGYSSQEGYANTIFSQYGCVMVIGFVVLATGLACGLTWILEELPRYFVDFTRLLGQ
jgi:hypothetical protein